MGNGVRRAKISSIKLLKSGDRCCTTTKAIPVFVGTLSKKCSSASRPPAEAPIPTTYRGAGATGGRLSGTFSRGTTGAACCIKRDKAANVPRIFRRNAQNFRISDRAPAAGLCRKLPQRSLAVAEVHRREPVFRPAPYPMHRRGLAGQDRALSTDVFASCYLHRFTAPVPLVRARR